MYIRKGLGSRQRPKPLLSGGLQASQASGAMKHKIVLETICEPGRLDRIYANDDD